jgi:hypothetical protein
MEQIFTRDYYKLFTGSNQEDGYENLFLAYESDVSEFLLKTDKTTYFHFPTHAKSINIQTSGLIEAGAVGGLTPYNSDRVFKRQGDYSQYSVDGDSLNKRDGEWACSWLCLSGTNGQPTWYDRYYLPGKVTYKEALENDKQDRFEYHTVIPSIYDIPSQLTFDPGVWYAYYHIGNNKLTNSLKSIGGENGELLTVDLKNWASTNNEQSNYTNKFNINRNGNYIASNSPFINSNQPSLDYSNSYLDTYVTYNSAIEINNNNELGLNFWLSHNNWNVATDSQIIGNLEKANYEVRLVTENKYNYFVLGLNQKYLAFFNYKGDNYTTIQLNYTPSKIIYDRKENVIVMGERNVQKYDYTGNLLFDLPTGFPVLDIAVYNNNDVGIITTGYFHRYDENFSGVIEAIDENYTERYLHIDKFDNLTISSVDSNRFVVDTNGDTYTAATTTIAKNGYRTSMSVNNRIQKIKIVNDELWVLSYNTKFTIFDLKTQTFKRGFSLNLNNYTPIKTNLTTFDFFKKYNPVLKQIETGVLVLCNYDNCLYELELDGSIRKQISLPQLFQTTSFSYKSSQFILRGDITGFDGKNIFYKNQRFLDFKVKSFDFDYNPYYFTARIDVTNTFDEKNWYLITANVKNNTLQIYINNTLEQTLTIPDIYQTKINFKNNIYIGQDSGITASLNNEIKTETQQFNGLLTNIKIYAKALSIEDIYFLLKEDIVLKDLYWGYLINKQQYIEEIERLFKHRLPGNKSNFFNIRIKNTENYPVEVKQAIEQEINKIVKKVAPAHTQLNKIIWQ